MSAIDPKYKGQDDFKLIEELQKVSGTEIPNAIKEIMNARSVTIQNVMLIRWSRQLRIFLA